MCFFEFLQSGEVTIGHLVSEGDVTLDSPTVPTIVQVRIKASNTLLGGG